MQFSGRSRFENLPTSIYGAWARVVRSVTTVISFDLDTFLLALTALLPRTNPIGSALVFAELVGDDRESQPEESEHQLAQVFNDFRLCTSTLGSRIGQASISG
jgi:hypothetical protein